jgi:predicted N-acyltransferase
MLSKEIYRSIYDLDQNVWNSHVDKIHFYHHSKFLSCLEDAKVENADFWYVMLKEKDTLICTAVLSAFTINLDLMIGSHWLSKMVRLSKTGLFKVKILFCGTPVSIGHKNIFIKKGYEKSCLHTIAETMDHIAAKTGIKHMVFKEFLDEDVSMMETIFLDLGYFRGYSLPYITLVNHWTDYTTYVKNLRSGYKRQILLSDKKCGREDSVKIMDTTQFDPTLFFNWYQKVMERAEVKLEILNESFFKLFFERMIEETKLFVYYKDQEPVCALLTIEIDKMLYFVWAGKPEERNSESDAYFNLLHHLVKYGIEHKFELIQLGQTAYYTKQRFGGCPKDVFLFYKARSRFKHLLLKKLSHIIFPKITLKTLHVFKDK